MKILNIKSFFFFRKIFSLIKDVIKLKISKYNKELQKILELNIMNYKLLVGDILYMKQKLKEKNIMDLMIN